MEAILVAVSLGFVVWLYFSSNPLHHSKQFMMRRFVNWFPLGMSYAFLYMARYNLNVAKNALGSSMSKESFGTIFAIGTAVYGCSFLVNGPLVDRIGGKKGILIATIGSSLANIGMGVATYLFLTQQLPISLTVVLAVLYGINMFFQSYGAVSIIKVKAYWFHVRERGIFGAIFGTFISAGVYFAFDWGAAVADALKNTVTGAPTLLHRIANSLFAVESFKMDSVWLVFFVPSGILLVWALLDFILIKDTPAEANLIDFDTHDASSGEMHIHFSMLDLLKRVFTNPIMIIISLVELTTGVIRNGVMQWYMIFAKEIPQIGATYFAKHWGFLLFATGVIASFSGGFISDKIFHSRRGPPATIFYAGAIVCAIILAVFLKSSPVVVGSAALLICMFSIGVHALMSGTAASDFGGRKATATAAGITDGFVYLGAAIQSAAIGYLVTNTKDWSWWPLFLIPFAIIGFFFTLRMWKSLPVATVKYLADVEHVDLLKKTPQKSLSPKNVIGVNPHEN